jgi:DNA (cytosine-5)-methyltransferase 1
MHRNERTIGKLTAIDLFAGAGGLSLAAIKLGLEVRAAVDNDVHACKTYRRNIIERLGNRVELAVCDISDISWKEFLQKTRLESLECDILLGGPPCQGFSTHRINGAGVGDPRNDLLLHYFAGMKAVKPKAFLVENVAGILWPRHARYLNRFLRAARQAGYRVFDPVILNARDFGVPQNRKRVFILGIREDTPWHGDWPPRVTHLPPESELVESAKAPCWITAEEVFKYPIRTDDPNAIHMQHSTKLRDVFRSTPKNGGSRYESNRVLPCHRNHDGHKDVYGRIDPSRPGPTMTTGCVNPSKGRFVHPTANHAITARHAARFQTFPDDFIFEGGLMAAARQIGNAVPIILGEIVIGSIIEGLGAATSVNMMATAS